MKYYPSLLKNKSGIYSLVNRINGKLSIGSAKLLYLRLFEYIFSKKLNKDPKVLKSIILESELVSGFMTEHAAVIFVFFFLAEYASIVLICIFSAILFLGGYLNFLPLNALIYIFNLFLQLIGYIPLYISLYIDYNFFFSSFLFSIYSSLNLAFKTSILVFIFI